MSVFEWRMKRKALAYTRNPDTEEELGFIRYRAEADSTGNDVKEGNVCWTSYKHLNM